jgi:hypothetical protein
MRLSMVEATNRAISRLARVDWAGDLLRRINSRGGVVASNEALLFEARFADALHRAGRHAVYEYATGVGGTTVDFLIPGSPNWVIELVSILDSDAVKDATASREYSRGIQVSTLSLSGDAADPRHTPAAELIRVIEKISEKVYDNRRKQAVKFPAATESSIHMVLVDMRGFEGIGAPDADHRRQICYGARNVRSEWNAAFDPITGKPVQGIFEVGNTRPAAIVAKERLHYVGFLSEEEFTDDELREGTRFVSNDHLVSSSQLGSYPLRPSRLA